MTGKNVVLSFWKEMATNDFDKASEWLTEDGRVYWPQSSELIIGRKNFADLNNAYPSYGTWEFQINHVVAEGNQIVTDVTVSDGTQKARAITFHTVENGLIRKQVEFWPEPYGAPGWRSQWVETFSSNMEYP